ncbi:hypothetical protein BD410DRAFT_785303, partial [Rickenella mellea]
MVLIPVTRQSKNVHFTPYTPSATHTVISCDGHQFSRIPPRPANWNFPEPTTSFIYVNRL